MSSQNSHHDLFGGAPAPTPEKAPAPGYSAAHIEVLEGLEAVRRRPGMYIGGTDERAFHHLFAEILDNSMDEAVAGWADRIEVVVDEVMKLRYPIPVVIVETQSGAKKPVGEDTHTPKENI